MPARKRGVQPCTLLPFSRERIVRCVNASSRRPYLRQYACSACGEGSSLCSSSGNASLSLPTNIDCSLAPGRLRNLSVAFVGDSLMGELHTLACCLLPMDGALSFALNLVPHRASLARMLRSALAAADVVIINFGLWYNYDPVAQPTVSRGVNESLVPALMEACVARGLRDGGPLGRACHTAACMLDPATDKQHIAYAFRRRYCAGASDGDAYASDLMRFASTLQAVAAERRWRATRLIWRDNTPQHYATPSGFFPTSRGATWPSAGGCAPIKEYLKPLANARNRLAEGVLAPLLHAHPSAPARLERMSTWGFDVARYTQHPHGKSDMLSVAVRDEPPTEPPLRQQQRPRTMDDCSHVCLHSDVARRWLEALVASLLAAAPAAAHAAAL